MGVKPDGAGTQEVTIGNDFGARRVFGDADFAVAFETHAVLEFDVSHDEFNDVLGKGIAREPGGAAEEVDQFFVL